MARPAKGNEHVETALGVIESAQTVKQLRQAQSVVLPLCYGLSLKETARLTGLSSGWVSKLRNRFLKGKLADSADMPGSGGRRGHFSR